MATQKELEKQIEKLEAERESLFKKKEPIDKALFSSYNKLKKLRDELGEILQASGKFDSIEYLIKTYNPNQESDAHYKALRNWGKAVKHSGYTPENNQPAFQVALKRDGSNIEQTISELKELMKYLQPSKKMEGRYFFIIFEHTLSYYCSYHMEIEPINYMTYVKNHLGHQSFYGTLQEAVKFISKHLWYN